jgi:deoxyribose-phosphate aldolase
MDVNDINGNINEYIEQTNIKPDATKNDILSICEEAEEFGFYAVAVMPTWLPLVVNRLRGTNVRIAAGISVPLGADTSETKSFAARQAIQVGADAVDIVMNIGALKTGDDDFVRDEICQLVDDVKKENQDTEIKIILECCYLDQEEIVTAARIIEQCGADFIKTSTGLGPSGARIEDVRLIRASVSETMGIKAAGGIKTREQAIALIRAGAKRIGTSSGVKIVQSG